MISQVNKTLLEKIIEWMKVKPTNIDLNLNQQIWIDLNTSRGGLETHSVFHEPINNSIDLNTSSRSIWINFLVL